jgi:hypothetical protein
MKLNQLNTKTGYNEVVVGANVELSYKDALFLYKAFNKLQENMPRIQHEVGIITDNIEPNEMIREVREVRLILESMHRLLVPIATEIIMPSTSIDIFNYNSVEEVSTINLKKEG